MGDGGGQIFNVRHVGRTDLRNIEPERIPVTDRPDRTNLDAVANVLGIRHDRSVDDRALALEVADRLDIRLDHQDLRRSDVYLLTYVTLTGTAYINELSSGRNDSETTPEQQAAEKMIARNAARWSAARRGDR